MNDLLHSRSAREVLGKVLGIWELKNLEEKGSWGHSNNERIIEKQQIHHLRV